MPKFPPELRKAWLQYQDLYDRYMYLLRRLGEATELDEVRKSYKQQIEYALHEWSDAQERFEMGCFDDIDLGIDNGETSL